MKIIRLGSTLTLTNGSKLLPNSELQPVRPIYGRYRQLVGWECYGGKELPLITVMHNSSHKIVDVEADYVPKIQYWEKP